MALNAGTISSAFGPLLNAAKAVDRSDGCNAHPLPGLRTESRRRINALWAGVRVDDLSSTKMKRCARLNLFEVYLEGLLFTSKRRPSMAIAATSEELEV